MFGTSWIFRILSSCGDHAENIRSITKKMKPAWCNAKLNSPTTYWDMAKL